MALVIQTSKKDRRNYYWKFQFDWSFY